MSEHETVYQLAKMAEDFAMQAGEWKGKYLEATATNPEQAKREAIEAAQRSGDPMAVLRTLRNAA